MPTNMENIPADNSGQIDRRQALKWIGAAAAAAAIFPHASAQDKLPRPAAPGGQRIGTDPLLNKNYTPGDLWSLTLTPKQRKAAASLSDLILPPDNSGDKLPSQLGVQEFIDEWISSPYDETNKDGPIITAGLDGSTRKPSVASRKISPIWRNLRNAPSPTTSAARPR